MKLLPILSWVLFMALYSCEPDAAQKKAANQKRHNDSVAKADSIKRGQPTIIGLKNELNNFNIKLEAENEELNRIKQIQNGRSGAKIEKQIETQSKNIQQLHDEIIILQTKITSLQK